MKIIYKIEREYNEIREIKWNKYWELNEMKIIFDELMKLWILNWIWKEK